MLVSTTNLRRLARDAIPDAVTHLPWEYIARMHDDQDGNDVLS